MANIIKANPTERIAGLAFFAFILLQVPFFLVESDLAASGMVLLSPLQVTAANLARTFPGAADAVALLLVPGAWVREAVSPLIVCNFRSHGRGPCDLQRGRLWDLDYVLRGVNLPLLVQLLGSGGLAPATPILYGSTMIVVSAAFSLVYSVKTAVAGFALLAYGVVAVRPGGGGGRQGHRQQDGLLPAGAGSGARLLPRFSGALAHDRSR